MYRLKIEADTDAQNPREDHDNADIMYCEHRRYSLGDKDAEKPYTSVDCVTLTSPAGTAYVLDDYNTADGTNLIMDDVFAMLEEHAEEAEAEVEAHADKADGYDQAAHLAAVEDAVRAASAVAYLSAAKWESEHRLIPGIAMIRPLSLYDHSGITISAGAPTCQWDSGYIGWQYITEAALKAEWNGDRDKALAYMDATLSTYDDYIQGNVYGFMLEKGTVIEKRWPNGHVEEAIEWEHEDSCWGFIGNWHGKDDPTGIRDSLPAEVRELFDSMDYTDEGEWQYTADVPEELQ